MGLLYHHTILSLDNSFVEAAEGGPQKRRNKLFSFASLSIDLNNPNMESSLE